MTTENPTRYQRTHYPTKRLEVRCTSRKPLKTINDGTTAGFCPDCNRFLERGGRDHKPEQTGSLGWVWHYADGSSRLVGPDQ